MNRLHAVWGRIDHLFRKQIWQPAHLNDTSLRGRGYMLLRIISITVTVFTETKAASRAAALSFSSLLGLGPLVAIAMVVAGMVLDQDDPNLAANTMNRVIQFIAPQVGQYESLTTDPVKGGAAPESSGSSIGRVIAPDPTLRAGTNPRVAPPVDGAAGEDSEVTTTANPELVEMLNGFIAGSRSSTAGALGALTLIFIVILLFKSIEDAFNEIWGVREGRSWLMRIIYYWTILTLGAVLFFASVTLLSASAFVNVFIEKLPYGPELLNLLRWMLPMGSGLLVVVILMLFYRYIPNTHVFWRAALIGAVVVALLLLLNNFLAFIYVRRVVLSKSLYGSLGIVPILMFGLYIFWLYVLIGGQISYAVQNVHYRSSQNAWSTLSAATRERLSLLVLLTIGRRFQSCLPPCTASELGNLMKVPTQVLNECVNRLVDMNFITPIPPVEADPSNDLRYQPARPLNRITLQNFKHHFENQGEAPLDESVDAIDPIVQEYHAHLKHGLQDEFFQRSLEQLFARHACEGSQPPFTFGTGQTPV